MDPPKPKKDPDDLVEVERALSVLKGRHPDHERTRREDEEVRAKRQAEIQAGAEVEAATARKRGIVTAVALVVSFSIFAVVAFFVYKELGRQKNVDALIAPFKAGGFTVVASSTRSDPAKLELEVQAGCYVGVGTSAPLHFDRAVTGTSFEGAGPLAFCLCEADRLTMTSSADAKGGMALLRIDTAQVGGSRAFPFASFERASTARTDDSCAEASLDAWLDAGKGPRAKPDEGWLKPPERKPLATYMKASRSPASAAFAVIDVPKDSCVLVTREGSVAPLTLRAREGATPVVKAKGAIAWCASKPAPIVITPESPSDGEIVSLVGNAADIGGISGLEELAALSKTPVTNAGVPSSDHAWNANQFLLASMVPPAIINSAGTEVPPDPAARVIAVSFGTPGALVADTQPDVYSYCEPPLDERTLNAFCIFSGPQTWRQENQKGVGGLARSALPFWLFTMQPVSDPVGLKAEMDLFRFARRLKRLGFEPTTLEGIVELPTGVEILGRGGEDSIVAVTVIPEAPWSIPLTDGPAWTLDGEPRVVPTKPLEKVKLTFVSNPKSKAQPRTIAFRHAKK